MWYYSVFIKWFLTCRDLDILVQNLTNAFTEQIHTIVSTNNAAPRQQVLTEMTTQIKNLKERIEPSEDVSTHPKSGDDDTKVSRSSKRNKRRKERSKLRKSLSKSKMEEQGEFKSEAQDARKLLDEKKVIQSQSVQSFMDKKRDERKMSRLSRFSRPISPIKPP